MMGCIDCGRDGLRRPTSPPTKLDSFTHMKSPCNFWNSLSYKTVWCCLRRSHLRCCKSLDKRGLYDGRIYLSVSINRCSLRKACRVGEARDLFRAAQAAQRPG